MYQIRRMTNLSLKEIGREFEGRDHTTVLHSIERIEKMVKESPETAEIIKDTPPTSTFATNKVFSTIPPNFVDMWKTPCG